MRPKWRKGLLGSRLYRVRSTCINQVRKKSPAHEKEAVFLPLTTAKFLPCPPKLQKPLADPRGVSCPATCRSLCKHVRGSELLSLDMAGKGKAPETG